MKANSYFINIIAATTFPMLLLGCNTSNVKSPQTSPDKPVPESPQQTNDRQTSGSKQSTSPEEKISDQNRTDEEILNEALNELQNEKNIDAQLNQTPSTPKDEQLLETNNSPANSNTKDKTPATGSLTSGEKSQQLDSELAESFAEFDKLLLKEQERLTKEQNEQGDLSQQEGSSGLEELDANSLEGIGQQEDGFDSADNNQTQETDESAFPSDNTRADIPPDLVSTKGDDIIAKQLREAALKETDPELRERLWDEYRKYKQGIKR